MDQRERLTTTLTKRQINEIAELMRASPERIPVLEIPIREKTLEIRE